MNFLLGIVQNCQVRDGVLESLLYSPMRSFLTFGYGGMKVEDSQSKFELDMDEKRRKANESFEPDRDKRNQYPGLEQRQ